MERNEGMETLAAVSDAMADAVEKVGPSVVRVHGRRHGPASGVVYAPGMVLTASHALERDEDIAVGTGDERPLAARLVGRDRTTGVAVLSVEGLEVPAAGFASGEARVGQLALAVGRSARSGALKATLGVVSAVSGSSGGPPRRRRRIERFIQTDAAPYRGLSGGALVDARGEVAGLLAPSPMRGAVLAVPADVVLEAARGIEGRGTAKRGYLGVLSQPVRLPEVQSADQESGLLVVGVEEDSPAGRAAVMVGDILTGLDGKQVERTEDLLDALAGKAGSAVSLEALRGGETVSLEVTVDERG